MGRLKNKGASVGQYQLVEQVTVNKGRGPKVVERLVVSSPTSRASSGSPSKRRIAAADRYSPGFDNYEPENVHVMRSKESGKVLNTLYACTPTLTTSIDSE